MSRQVISFDKGTKRNMDQIRWRPFEVISIFSLLVVTIALGVWLALREASNYPHVPRTPEVKSLR
jgi:hypothetical protein